MYKDAVHNEDSLRILESDWWRGWRTAWLISVICSSLLRFAREPGQPYVYISEGENQEDNEEQKADTREAARQPMGHNCVSDVPEGLPG